MRAHPMPVVALPIDRKRPVGLGSLYTWFGDHPCDVVNTHSSTDSWLTGLAQLALGRTAEAIALLEHQPGQLPPGHPEELHATLAYAYALAGRSAEARRQIMLADRSKDVPLGRPAVADDIARTAATPNLSASRTV